MMNFEENNENAPPINEVKKEIKKEDDGDIQVLKVIKPKPRKKQQPKDVDIEVLEDAAPMKPKTEGNEHEKPKELVSFFKNIIIRKIN